MTAGGVPAAIAHTSTVTVVGFVVFASTLNDPPGKDPLEALTLTGCPVVPPAVVAVPVEQAFAARGEPPILPVESQG